MSRNGEAIREYPAVPGRGRVSCPGAARKYGTEVSRSRTRHVSLIVLLGVLTAFAPLSTDMYLAAFPAMARDLGADVGRIQLSLAIFFIGLAAGQLVWGPLSDRLGRRIPLMAGLVVYSLASVGLAMSRDVSVFLALRLVQALGGCAGMVISRAVVRDNFDVAASAKVLTLMMAVQSIGPVAAPVLGAYLLTLAPWRAVFWLLTLLGLGCLAASWRKLDESHPPEKRVKQSVRGVAGVLGGLFANRSFIIPALAGSIGGSAIFAFISTSPHVLMGIYGQSSTAYAWTFALISLGTGIFAQVNVIALKKLTARRALSLGLGAMVVLGAVSLAIVALGEAPSLPVFLAFLFPTLAMVPVIFANSTALAMSASGRFAGAASSLIGMIQFGMAGLVSVLVSLLHDGTARPMVGAILACGLTASVVMIVDWLASRRS